MMAPSVSSGRVSFSAARPLSARGDEPSRTGAARLEPLFTTLGSPTASGNTNAWGPPGTARPQPPQSTIRLARASTRPARPTDASLVRDALEGQARAPEAIWARYSPMVRARLSRTTGNQDVDDHVQEVFLRLFEHLEHLRDPDSLRSFIIGITLRIAGTELRRRRCRGWLVLTASGDLPERSAPADDTESRQVLARLSAILSQLAPTTSRFFVLRYVEDRELVDVALAMGVSLATAKRHLTRASSRVYAMAEREPVLAGYLQAAAARWRPQTSASATI